MTGRRIDGFFYGLFMDPDVLRDNAVAFENPRKSYVDNYALHIGRRATLVASRGSRAYGMTYALTHDEIGKLYSGPGLEDYCPEAVLAVIDEATAVPAICYNLQDVAHNGETNLEYAERLRSVLSKFGFPEAYIKSVGCTKV